MREVIPEELARKYRQTVVTMDKHLRPRVRWRTDMDRPQKSRAAETMDTCADAWGHMPAINNRATLPVTTPPGPLYLYND